MLEVALYDSVVVSGLSSLSSLFSKGRPLVRLTFMNGQRPSVAAPFVEFRNACADPMPRRLSTVSKKKKKEEGEDEEEEEEGDSLGAHSQ